MSINKLTYEEAKVELAILVKAQTIVKRCHVPSVELNKVKQQNLYHRCREINYLLSLIKVYKSARKMYHTIKSSERSKK